jgi:hypothetical protein
VSFPGLPRTRLDLVTRVTGVVAGLCVVGTTVTVLTVHTGRAAPDHPSLSRRVGPVVVDRLAHVSFRLPADDRWTRTGRRAVAGFRSTDGEADPVVSEPAYFRRGWCPRQPRWSSRALVGIARPAGSDDTRAVNAAVSSAWLRALAATTPPAWVRHRHQSRRGRGWLTSAYVDTSGSRAPCTPPRVWFQALSLDTGADVATVVVVADGDVPGALGRHAIDRILAGVRVLR